MHEPPRTSRVVAAVVGLLAAAASVGAMLGFGVRAGVPSRGFNAIAAVVVGDAARGVWGWDGWVTPVGISVLALVMFAWGVSYVALARRARGWWAIVPAVVVGGVAWGVATLAVSRRLPGDPLGVLGPGQLAGLHLVLAVTLVAGMRFALGGNEGSREAAEGPGS